MTDLDRSVDFYETLGLTCTSRTDIPDAIEAILENPEKGWKVQLAQQKAQDGPIDMGTAMWKLYVNTDDIEGLYDTALGAGFTSLQAPERLRPLAGQRRVRRRPRRLPGRAGPTTPVVSTDVGWGRRVRTGVSASRR